MRMRKRPNLEPRMAKCADYLVEEPETLRGMWRESLGGCSALCLELGCGKGRFTADMAAACPDSAIVALEKVRDAMVIAMERARDRALTNVRFVDGDAARLGEMFADGEIDRIYINFCDPWPKSRDAKFRLTAPSFLRTYCDVLPAGGQIHFKTDNRPLFDWSVEQLKAEGWELSEVTNDLHSGGQTEIILTDYEVKFIQNMVKINRLVATRTADTKGRAAGSLPRLRNAALTDARGFGQDAEAGDGESER